MTTLPKQITHWSIEDVCHWMKENRFEEELESFRGKYTFESKVATVQSPEKYHSQSNTFES